MKVFGRSKWSTSLCSSVQVANGMGSRAPPRLKLRPGLNWYLKYWCGAHISWDKTGGVQRGSRAPPRLKLRPGLNWYLKYWCGAHISWDKTGGVQLSSINSKPWSTTSCKS
ncbi:hypothetical protein IFM89_014276 [Coptis chinensis]|uniref:Uncharacterized protein n=1 Tax=Coptis chinensis TaxID=261450 RepID=A0A835H521_9MAGN|nr:hypothetical protein IFM89_014276 [Coptis chinensis]